MKSTEEGKWLCETAEFVTTVEEARKDPMVQHPMTHALQEMMLWRDPPLEIGVWGSNYRELCKLLEDQLAAATDFARWCVSEKFDSRDISWRAQEVLKKVAAK